MDNHRNVKGTLKQPFNLNPYYVTSGNYTYTDRFDVAGKYINTTYSDYYDINTNEKIIDDKINKEKQRPIWSKYVFYSVTIVGWLLIMYRAWRIVTEIRKK